MKFIAFVKRATGRDVRIVRTDGGKEYDNDVINNFFTAEGIVHQITVPYTPSRTESPSVLIVQRWNLPVV